MNQKKREDGYYRVKNAFGTWIIAYYYSQTGVWSLPGVSGSVYSRHLQEINENRINELAVEEVDKWISPEEERALWQAIDFISSNIDGVKEDQEYYQNQLRSLRSLSKKIKVTPSAPKQDKQK